MQNSKNKKWIIIGIVLVALWAVGTAIKKDKEPVETTALPQLTANEIRAKDLISSITTEYLIKIDGEVKKQFAYPEEVSYGSLSYPASSNTIVLDTVAGKILTAGDVVGKNAFGVKSQYQYRAFGHISVGGPVLEKVDLIQK